MFVINSHPLANMLSNQFSNVANLLFALEDLKFNTQGKP